MTADERRQLKPLAATNAGCTADFIKARGFDITVAFNVAKVDLATVHAGRGAGGGAEIARVRATEAGRRALADGRKRGPDQGGWIGDGDRTLLREGSPIVAETGGEDLAEGEGRRSPALHASGIISNRNNSLTI
jgi:hypothetical protein